MSTPSGACINGGYSWPCGGDLIEMRNGAGKPMYLCAEHLAVLSEDMSLRGAARFRAWLASGEREPGSRWVDPATGAKYVKTDHDKLSYFGYSTPHGERKLLGESDEAAAIIARLEAIDV